MLKTMPPQHTSHRVRDYDARAMEYDCAGSGMDLAVSADGNVLCALPCREAEPSSTQPPKPAKAGLSPTAKAAYFTGTYAILGGIALVLAPQTCFGAYRQARMKLNSILRTAFRCGQLAMLT